MQLEPEFDKLQRSLTLTMNPTLRRDTIAIKNRESNRYAEDCLMENWMDMDETAKVESS